MLTFNNMSFVQAAPAAGAISGQAFRDYNANGVKDVDEPGIENVNVSAIDDLGNTAVAVTVIDGTYALASLAGNQARVEFTLPASLSFLKPGAAGGTTVQFIDISGGDVANIDIGFNNPAQYSQPDPQVATTRFEPGLYSTNGSVVAVNSHTYSADGSGQTLTNYANIDQVGTLYGMAYEATSGVLWGSAYVRRGASLGPTDSTGAIYKLTGTGAPSLFIDLNAAGVSTGANPHPNGTTSNWVVDSGAYAAVGTVGLGDIDISDDSQRLYAVNLNTRELVIMPLTYDVAGQPVPPSSGAISSIAIPVPAQCNGNGTTAPHPDDWRPFALKSYDGQLYVGGICSAQTMLANTSPYPSTFADLAAIRPQVQAHVFQFDPGTNSFGASPILSIPMDYARERINGGLTADNDGEWLPWNDDWRPSYSPGGTTTSIKGNPQPMLVDIEFDGDGFMTLGFRDRFADQAYASGDPGPSNVTPRNQRFGGDVLLACLNASSNWQLESSSSCTNGLTGEVRTAGGSADSGGSEAEFYHNDQYINSSGNPQYHDETAWGALALLHGSDEIVVTKYDTFATNEAGTTIFNEANGNRLRAVQIYPPNQSFAKAGGIGDIELLTDPAPLEIGNRLWCDAGGAAGAGNGVQDPDEDPINAATVTLSCDTDGNVGNGYEANATAVTDASGNYLFADNTGNVTLANGFPAAHWNASVAIIPRTASCRITVDPTQTAMANSCGAGNYGPTTPDNGGVDAASDMRDSDGLDNVDGSGNTGVTFTTGGSGHNNHTYDFGFAMLDLGDLPDADGGTGSFPTNFNDGGEGAGASHVLSSNLYLGACVDSDLNGAPDAAAGTDGSGGDDSGDTAVSDTEYGTCSTAGDDEDGVTLVTPMIPGYQACVSVTAVNTGASANLYGWIDFNGDGDFAGDADELLDDIDFASGSATIAASGTADYCFTVPTGATFSGGDTHMRFRLTTDTGLSYSGPATNGEVEDYYQQFTCVGNYVWSDVNGDGLQAGESGLNGVGVQLVWFGMDDAAGGTGANADRTYTATTAQESGVDGKYSFCGLIPEDSGNNGGVYRVGIPSVLTGMDLTTPNVGANDIVDSDGTQAGGNGTAVTGPNFTVTSPTSMTTGENSSGDSVHPNSFPDNQDDLSFDFGFASYDYGDHADNNGAGAYPTTNTDGGEGAAARHTLDNTNYLGSCVDAETDGQSSATANGDNSNTAGAPPRVDGAVCSDDEDGVDSPVSVGDGTWGDGDGDLNINNVVGSGCLVVWVDWSGDGDFGDAPNGVSELIYVGSVASGSQAINFPTQVDADHSGSYAYPSVLNARFRLFTAVQLSDWGVSCNGAGVSSRFTGSAKGGEVEDYQWSFNGPTAVSLQNIAVDQATAVPALAFVAAGLLGLATIGIGAKRRRQIARSQPRSELQSDPTLTAEQGQSGYQKLAIVYETVITTRAGSPLDHTSFDDDINPDDLFDYD
ncbi:MAG: hypothetical protein GY803_27245 [Chloroflexi bacterium]|nr:hypothetical protein [Chloroflexota bacterium]